MCYPKEIKTLADRIRKRRLDLGLRQCGVGQLLGVHVTTVTNWELGRSEPALRHLPGLFGFLDNSPRNAPQDSLPIPQQLKTYRRLHRLSQKGLPSVLRVDATMV